MINCKFIFLLSIVSTSCCFSQTIHHINGGAILVQNKSLKEVADTICRPFGPDFTVDSENVIYYEVEEFFGNTLGERGLEVIKYNSSSSSEELLVSLNYDDLDECQGLCGGMDGFSLVGRQLLKFGA